MIAHRRSLFFSFLVPLRRSQELDLHRHGLHRHSCTSRTGAKYMVTTSIEGWLTSIVQIKSLNIFQLQCTHGQPSY